MKLVELKQTRLGLAEENGSVMTEAAIVFPLLIAVIAGIVQYGFLFSATIALKNAAAVGARNATLETGGTLTSVCNSINSALPPNMDSTLVSNCALDASFTIPGGSGGANRVSFDYSYDLFFPFIVPQADSNGNLMISTEVVMR